MSGKISNPPASGATEINHRKLAVRTQIQVALLSALLIAGSGNALAELRIATAANFAPTLTELIKRYQADTPEFSASVSSGSSGKHYAQILQGAPFDVFFSADDQRTEDLMHSGHALPESRFAYALGQLVLWSPAPELIPEDGLALLRSGNFRRLAIANPRVAPYGAAAEHLLASSDIELQRGQRVTGQSIGQAFNYVRSGNAELGLLAASQVILYERDNNAGSRWTPAAEQYPPIVQEVVILQNARDHTVASAFLHWIRCSQEARGIIEADGYHVPELAEASC